MSITKLGLKEVDEAYHHAKEHLIYAKEQLVRAEAEVIKMEKCHNCSHVKLEDMGASIRCETRCTDCGFTWFD